MPAISRLSNPLASIRTATPVGLALRNDAVAGAAPHFWRRCQQLGFVDFSSIVYKSYCLLRDQPMIARSLAARFASFLIDEFQDTTEIQIEILKLIHAQHRSRIFAVGDHAQSIFGFTGPRPELIQPFAAHIGARTDLSLAPAISVRARRSSSMPTASSRAARACKAWDRRATAVAIAPVLVQQGRTIDAITGQFLPMLAAHNIALGDAAILSKDWASLFPLSRGLREFGVPVVGPGARPYRRSRLFASLAEQLCGYMVDPGAHIPAAGTRGFPRRSGRNHAAEPGGLLQLRWPCHHDAVAAGGVTPRGCRRGVAMA